MVMSTQILDEAAELLETVLIDSIQVYDLSEPVTTGFTVSLSKTPVGGPIPALVQTTSLANAVESLTESVYSIKVARGTELIAGQAIEVLTCEAEPSLEGKTLLIDKVSQNGLSIIRKAIASDSLAVRQEGKGEL